MMNRLASGFDSSRGSGGSSRLLLSRRAVLVTTLQALASLVACTAPLPQPLITSAPSPANNQGSRITPGLPAVTPSGATSCAGSLPAVVPPTPIPYPGYAQQEPETGLHVTGGAQHVDLASYRLQVSGLVRRPISLSYDDLRCLPKVAARVRLECPGYFVDWQTLAGPTLASVIALADPQPDVARVTLTSVTGYFADFSLEEVQGEENFLAYEWRGELLPASHGFPLRAALPGKMGSDWVKWLGEIRLS
jgi:DMSO/TMAO reductase YedYZ molybdopterin-dependent catalytic subunit